MIKRTYTITITPALVAPDLCWRWEIECAHVQNGEVQRHDDIGSGLTGCVADAATAATTAAAAAESAYIDGEDVTCR